MIKIADSFTYEVTALNNKGESKIYKFNTLLESRCHFENSMNSLEDGSSASNLWLYKITNHKERTLLREFTKPVK